MVISTIFCTECKIPMEMLFNLRKGTHYKCKCGKVKLIHSPDKYNKRDPFTKDV